MSHSPSAHYARPIVLPTARWMLVICLFVGALLSHSLSAETDDASVLPQKPTDHLLDQARWLTVDEREKITALLTGLKLNHSVEVFVVVRFRHPPQGAESYSRQLGRKWASSDLWCVIYQVPEDPAGVHVEFNATTPAQKAALKSSLDDGLRRARRESTEKERFQAAIHECADAIRFVSARQQRSNEAVAEKANVQRQTGARLFKRKKLILIGAGVAGVLFLGLLGWLFSRKKQSTPASFEFPETSWKQRFQAPHSGGNAILVNFKSKRLK